MDAKLSLTEEKTCPVSFGHLFHLIILYGKWELHVMARNGDSDVVAKPSHSTWKSDVYCKGNYRQVIKVSCLHHIKMILNMLCQEGLCIDQAKKVFGYVIQKSNSCMSSKKGFWPCQVKRTFEYVMQKRISDMSYNKNIWICMADHF